MLLRWERKAIFVTQQSVWNDHGGKKEEIHARTRPTVAGWISMFETNFILDAYSREHRPVSFQ